MLGRQGDLLYRPAVLIQPFDRNRLEFQRLCQQPGFPVERVMEGDHLKGLVLGVWDDGGQDQVVPDLGPEGAILFNPLQDLIRGGGRDWPAFVTPSQGAYPCLSASLLWNTIT